MSNDFPPIPPELPQTPPPFLPPQPQHPKEFTQTFTFKILFIVILSVVLLIPDAFLFSIIDERESRLSDTVQEIGETWSGPQNFIGPMITIPYRTGASEDSTGVVTLLPASLEADAEVTTQTLSRGIYETVVYNATISMAGNITLSFLKELPIALSAMRLDEATVTIGVGELKGIENLPPFEFGNEKLEFEGGFISSESPYKTHEGSECLTARVNLSGLSLTEEIPYSITFTTKGSESVSFAPVGKKNTVKISGDSSSPSFEGMSLPSSREIDGKKFNAVWHINSINRSYPQAFIGSSTNAIISSAVGASLLVPVDSYQKTSRALKYAIIVILLTFIAVLFAETMLKHPIHVFQYLLIGLALVLFYSLLLSLAEHIGFGGSYLIASVLTISMVGTYVWAVLASRRTGLLIVALLAVIYTYIYVLLSLETYALLAGSLGLFIALAAIMYASLKMKLK